MLRIHSVETFGTHEGPGIRLVIFLQGCEFRCLYCHNPDTQSKTGGKLMSIEEIMQLVGKEKGYFGANGGVTASGGEPILQAKELGKLFEVLQKVGVYTALDTNGGSVIDDDVAQLLKHTNLVLLDVKHIDSEKHKVLTGRDNTHTLEFAKYCEERGINMWLRHVLVPGYTDDPEDLENLAKYFKDYRHVERLEILPYHTLGVFKYKKMGKPYTLEGVKPPTKEQIENAKRMLERHLVNVHIR